MSILHQLLSITDRKKKRVGRGYGSGKGGHTSGRGQKGQKSRRGATIPVWFEGGQLPLIKRLPMWRGKDRFSSVRSTAQITLANLESMKSSTITLDTLKEEKLIESKFKRAKIIATGVITRKLSISGIGVSAKAKSLIEAAGGSVE
jgi:large subunit ribosomal protein L15